MKRLLFILFLGPTALLLLLLMIVSNVGRAAHYVGRALSNKIDNLREQSRA